MAFKIASRAVLGLALLWLLVEVVSHVGTEILWFQELGYSQVFLLRLKTQVALWAIATTATSGFWLGILAIAERLKYPLHTKGERSRSDDRSFGETPQQIRRNPVAFFPKRQLPITPSPIELPWLLSLLLGLSLVVGLMVMNWGQIATWAAIDFELPDILLPLPNQFGFNSIWPMAKQIPSHLGQLSLLLAVLLALLVNPRRLLQAIALLMSLGFGLIASNHWDKVLQYFHPAKFNITDPLFNHDKDC